MASPTSSCSPLPDADQPVGEEAFASANDNLWLDDMAVNLQRPEHWLPHTVFRFYASADWPRVLLFVSVLLQDRYDKYAPIEDCLLTDGAFIHKGEAWSAQDWELWWARWHGSRESRHDDGRLDVSESKDSPQGAGKDSSTAG